MSARRQVLGGLLALLLVGGAMAASGVLAFTEQGTPVAQVAATVTFTLPPATLAPTASATPPTATQIERPSATATTLPSASPTALPTDTSTPTETPTASPEPTATVVPVTFAPPPTQCIPAPPPGWVVYIIQRGDTLSNLARQFGVSLANLQRVNCIANASDINFGQRIYAPNVAPPTPFPTAIPSETPAEPTEVPTIPGDVPTITSEPIATATPDCVPPEFYDPFLNRCRLPDPTPEGGSP